MRSTSRAGGTPGLSLSCWTGTTCCGPGEWYLVPQMRNTYPHCGRHGVTQLQLDTALCREAQNWANFLAHTNEFHYQNPKEVNIKHNYN